MRRFKTSRYELGVQVRSAANGILGEPAWPAGVPTHAEVLALADEFDAKVDDLREKENVLLGARAGVLDVEARCQAMVRRIDNITSGLYGADGYQKGMYGLRPKDTTRNSYGPTPQVVKLVLRDGPEPGSILAEWKTVPGAVYEIQWFDQQEMEALLGSRSSTRSKLLISGLAPGRQFWIRVRAVRSRRTGEWSETATRIANV